jgi:hypothetical protein
MESFSAVRNWNRVAAGFKGGGFFEKGSAREPLTFVEGWPNTSIEKFEAPATVKDPTPIDSWNERRNKNV